MHVIMHVCINACTYVVYIQIFMNHNFIYLIQHCQQLGRMQYSQVRVKFEGEDGSGPGVNRGFFASFATALKNPAKVGSSNVFPGWPLYQPIVVLLYCMHIPYTGSDFNLAVWQFLSVHQI